MSTFQDKDDLVAEKIAHDAKQDEIAEGEAKRQTEIDEVIDSAVAKAEEKEESQVAGIDQFLKTRREMMDKVTNTFVEGKDYHVIKGTKSLAKGGAEKLASCLQWSAAFERDMESVEMLGNDIPGLVAYRCELKQVDRVVGEGRGASLMSNNANDPNKTLKMAQKSAFIDAVLRTSGMSDIFTQDIEDMPSEEIGKVRDEEKEASPKQRELILSLCKQKGISGDKLKGLAEEYPNPSELIDHLLGNSGEQVDANL